MSGAQVQLEAGGTFVQDPQYTLFSRTYDTREVYVAESFEIPFDKSVPAFGGTVSARIPPKGDLVRRLTVRSTLPQLYTPLGPGYVYPQYTDEVDGSIYVQTNTLAIQPGDFVGYFNTQFLSAWATNFVGYANISVSYNSTVNKFVFTSPTYSNIFFQNEGSASFWGFDIRSPDFTTTSGFPAYNFTSGTLTAPLTLVQAGWIRGFTPPPSNGFSYVDSVATKLIKSATLTVGGQTIDRLTSERLYLEQDLGVAYENQAGLTVLEGKNDTSVVSAPREYYTKLTFNMDTLNMNELYRNDVRVDIEYEKFGNLASSPITSNGFLDGASYVTSNLQAITADGTQNFSPRWAIGWKNYVIIGPLLNESFRFYNQDTGTFYKWTPGSGTDARITTNGGTLYGSSRRYLKKAVISTILSSSTTPWTTSTYSFFALFPITPYYEGQNKIYAILTDARYVYLLYAINYFIIGSTYTNLVSGSLAGDLHTWTITYRFWNVTAPLSATNNVAMLNFVSTYTAATDTTTVIADQPTTVALTSPGTVTQLTLTFASAPASVVVNNQVYNSGTATQLTAYITTGPIRVIALSGATVTIQFPSQSVPTIPSGTNVSFRVGPSISSQTTVGLYTVLAMSAYYNALQTAGNAYIPANQVHPNLMWVRYDTFGSFDSASSYTFTLTSQGLPASVKDAYPGLYERDVLPNTAYYFSSSFDGQYLYFPTKDSYISRLDTQNFTSTTAYSNVNASILSPNPINNSGGFVSDGRYLYTGSSSTINSNGTFSRYDSTKPINQQASWEYFTNDTLIRPSDFNTSTTSGFDGKYIYYYTEGSSESTFRRLTAWHKYDTTKPFGSVGSWEWIDFRSISDIRASDGSNPQITINGHRTDVPSTDPGYDGVGNILRFITGSRYIYIVECDNNQSGIVTLSDFIQYNPVTMSNVLSSSSIITKYEKYPKPPNTGKMLYGQSDVETFTIQPGAQTSEFQLRFLGPVRELWISVDAPYTIRRLILRLNGEILVDDDQVTTQTIRAFESHTSVSNVAVFNFALDPESLAPSGTLNMSRIASPMLEVQLTSSPIAAANVRVYSKSYNVFQANNGTGGLLFNSAF